MSSTRTTLHSGPSEHPGTSWGAVLAGTAVAAATTLVLALVGSGIGLYAASPFSGGGPDASTFAVSAGIWLIVMQWLSSGLGGYVAGRLRTPWTSTRGDEVLFRDTAHGVLAWAVATLLTVMMFSHAATGLVSTAARGAAAVSGSAVQAAASAVGPVSEYDLDRLLRPSQPTALPGPDQSQIGSEIASIVTRGIRTGDIPQADRNYLAQVVAARTAVTPEEARARVDQLIQGARETARQAAQAAEAARKTSARVALFTALSMLIGALIAGAAAGYGGKARDEP